MTSPLVSTFFEKIKISYKNNEDSLTKIINITEEKEKMKNDVPEISKIDSDGVEKSYALKAFDAKVGSYHYKRNIKKPIEEDVVKKKKKEMVIIEKLGDLVNIEKKD